MGPLLAPLSPPFRGRWTPEIGVFGPLLNPTARTRGYIYSIYIHPDPRIPRSQDPGVDVSTPYTPPEVTSLTHYISLHTPRHPTTRGVEVVYGVTVCYALTRSG